MTAGFPRPRKLVQKVKLNGEYVYPNNDFSKWDNKTYPIPYSARMDKVGKIYSPRLVKCRVGDLCIVCGTKVEDKRPWAYTWGEGDHLPSDAGPFHDKCKTLTQTMCPVVSENLEIFRFIRVSWTALRSRELPASQKRHYRKNLKEERGY